MITILYFALFSATFSNCPSATWFQARRWQHFTHDGITKFFAEYNGTFGGRTDPQLAAERLLQWPGSPAVVTVITMQLSAKGFCSLLRDRILTVAEEDGIKKLRFRMSLLSEAWAGWDLLYRLDEQTTEIQLR